MNSQQYLLRSWKKKELQLTGLDWYILTIANPDGYHEVFTGMKYEHLVTSELHMFLSRHWRTNKNPKYLKQCGYDVNNPQIQYGVDLNRSECLNWYSLYLNIFIKKLWLLLV